MAFKLTISVGGKKLESIKFKRIDRGKRKALREGLLRGGSVLFRQLDKNLSGPSHTLFPGNSNPYPGRLTGNLLGSLKMKLIGNGTGVVVGPGKASSDYSAALEKPGHGSPGYPYMKPTWDQKGEEEINEIANVLFGLLR